MWYSVLRQASPVITVAVCIPFVYGCVGCRKDVNKDEKTPSRVALFVEAAGAGDFAAVQEFLEHGMNINARDEETEQTALLAAVDRENFDMVRFLLQNGADINLVGGQGFTPLHRAVLDGTPAMVLLLLDRGAYLEGQDDLGRTPLILASRYNRVDMVETLLKKGASTQSPDVLGRTPLHWAASPAVAKLLLGHGADPNARDANGLTPWETAAKDGKQRSEVARYLRTRTTDQGEPSTK